MQEHKYPIKHWAIDDRPREKLLSLGVENLSNSELLGILIQSGTKQHSAVDLARQVLRLGNDSLQELGKLTVSDLRQVRGVGSARAITIAAAMELGRRRKAGSIEKVLVTGSADTARYLQAMLADYRYEVFGVIFLNQANRINHFEVVSRGGITGTVADPRVILRLALEHNAVSIVLCHNHPSGNPQPSRADKELTTKVKEAARHFDIRLLDHIIVGDPGYFSFADEGLI